MPDQPHFPIALLPLGPADLLLALATVLAALFCGLLAWRLARQEKAGAAALAGLRVELAGLQEQIAAAIALQETSAAAERDSTRQFVEETVRDAATITATEVISHAREEIDTRSTALSEEIRDAMSEALARHGAELRGEITPTVEELLAELLPPAIEAAFPPAFEAAFPDAFPPAFAEAFTEAFGAAFDARFPPAFADAFEPALDRERLAEEMVGLLSGPLAETFAEAFATRMEETVSAADAAARERIEAEIPGLRSSLTEALTPVLEERIAIQAGEFLTERLQGEIGARLAPAVETAMERAGKLLAADLHDMAEAELARAAADRPPASDPSPADPAGPAALPHRSGGLISVHSGRRR
ncbi:hypothetical protein [Paroceanicella profunda]|uniref:hypothetical protein n=1 Tax=Paroceanicella profunda TaxID=2579971 RepID=UPI0014789139|nr:hypothetical protein [Paroceanicella profunda]